MKSNQSRSLRSQMIEPLVQHNQYKTGLEALEKLFAANAEDGYVDGLYITGPTNIGKTFLKNQFLAKHRSYETEDRTVIPILSFSMPTAGDGKAIYQAALAAMHSRYLMGTETALGQRLIDLLISCRTKLLFVDEAQHFIQRNGRKNQERAADNLKTLMNEAGTSVVLMGTDLLRELLTVNEQLRRRFSTKIKLRAWDPNDEKDIDEVGSVVATVMIRSGIALGYEELLDPAFLKRLIYGTGGRIGFVVKLLIEAAMLAEANKQKEFKRLNFEQAFCSVIWDEAVPAANPFGAQFAPEKMNVPGNPFRVEA